MKFRKSIALATALAIAIPLAPTTLINEVKAVTSATTYSAGQVTNDLIVDVLFGETDTFDIIAERNVVLTLYKNGSTQEVVSLNPNGEQSELVEIFTRDASSNINPKTGEKLPENSLYSYRLNFTGLAPDTYTVSITGENYVSYSQSFVLTAESKYVKISSTLGGFAYGDFDGDKSITDADLDLMVGAFGAENSKYDVDGDGEVTLTDLSIVKLNQDFEATTVETITAINDASVYLDTSASADIKALMSGGDATFKASEDGEAVIEIEFAGDSVTTVPEISELSFEVTAESASVVIDYYTYEYKTEYDDDDIEYTVISDCGEGQLVYNNVKGTPVVAETMMIFGLSASRMSNTTTTNAITIDLGTRVAVKKITVTVTEEEGELVTVSEVTLLQDIVPEDPYKYDGIVTLDSDKVVAGNESLSISWQAVQNVAGYKVSYGEKSGSYSSVIYTSTTSASISDLENLTPYYIVVQSISGDWSSVISNEVVGIPQPTSRPGTPRDVEVTEEDQGATFAWKDAKDAETYNVYIRYPGESTTTLVASGLKSFTYTIRGLVNDQDHYVQISASNAIGEGSKTTEVKFTPQSYEVIGPDLPEYNRMDNSNIKNITFGSNTAYDTTWSSPDFTPWYMVDEDYSTSWVPTAYTNSTGFIIEFKEAVTMDYVVLVEKLDRDGYYIGQTGNFTITVWSDEYPSGKTLVYMRTVNVQRYTADNGVGYMVLPFAETENITKIQIGTRIWDGCGKMQSISEIAFYEADDLDKRIDALFSDVLQTKLASGVTQTQIDELKEEVEQILSYVTKKSSLVDDLEKAERLLNNANDTSMIGYIKDDFMVTGNTFLPLGVVGLSKFDLRVFVTGVDEGETLTFGYSQFYDETGTATFESAVQVYNGENYLTVPEMINISGAIKGGSMYYKYSGDSPEDVQVHFYRMVGLSNTVDYTSKIIAIPTLELSDITDIAANETLVKERMTAYVEALNAYQKLTYEDLEVNLDNYPFQNEVKLQYSVQTNPVNSTEISYNSVLHSIPATQAYAGFGSKVDDVEAQVAQLYESALAWEELLNILNYSYGYDDPTTASRQHNKYMRQTATSAAYAAGSHIGVGWDWCSSVVGGASSTRVDNGSSTNLFGWGYAHEFGHNMDRIGDVEASNNLYSQLSVTWDGDKGQLSSNSRVPWSDVYNVVANDLKATPSNVFTKLGMYWQLHLAYSIDGPNDNSNPFDFYHEMNSNLANGNRLPLAASLAAGKDLTDFFEAWGYTVADSDKAAIATALANGSMTTEDRNIEYLNDASRNYRIAGGTSIANDPTATFSVEASISGQNVTVSIENNIDTSKIVGYKIMRDGAGIGFVTSPDANGNYSYTDVISSINNVSFVYSVQPVDILGYFVGSPAQSEQIAIKYNKVLDEYVTSVDEVDNGYLFTMSETVNTSGVVIDGEFTTGSFIVSIGLEQESTDNILVVNEVDSATYTSNDLGDYEILSDTDDYTVDSDTTDVNVKKISTIFYETEINYTVAKIGDFSKNSSTIDGEYLNYFNKADVVYTNPDDTRISVYDANTIMIQFYDLPDGVTISPDDIHFIEYVSDSVEFTEYKMGVLTHDYEDFLFEGDIIVVGNYIGDVYFNEIALYGLYADGSSMSSDSTDFVTVEYTERAISGDMYMFATVPEGGVVSTISDGLFIFKMNVDAENALNDEHSRCSVVSLYPSQFKAVMTANDSQGESRITSYTGWEYTPSEEEMPTITLISSAE